MTPEPPPARLRWQDAVVERVEHWTPRVVGVTLRAPIGRHLAGQHVDIRLTAPDGYRAERSYSIASAPGSATVKLAIERMEEGEVSPYFHEVAQPGDTIELRGPIGGHFVWRPEDGGPLLLVGGGSGVVPLMAMLRHRAAAAPGTAALLVYSARSWEELIFRDELLNAERSQPALRLAILTTRGPKHRPQDFAQRLDAPLMQDLLAGWRQAPRHVYVCGSNPFVEAATAALIGSGIAPAGIRTERYGG